MRAVGLVIASVVFAAGLLSVGINARRLADTKPIKQVSTGLVGTQPGGVSPASTSLRPKPGDRLIGFSAGCFWGSEEAFRRMPGIVATAVGYTGGFTTFPSYETSHKTGHLETVLVEFDPQRTPFASLLHTFWGLRRANDLDIPGSTAHAAIWTYDSSELSEAIASRQAIESKTHKKLRLRIEPAKPFYLAEPYHQQYDEKTGTEACPIGN